MAESMKKIEEVIIKVWDMAQANLKQDNPPVVRQATLEWARDELLKAITIVEKQVREKVGEFIEKRRNACQLNAEQIDCRLCLSELLEALKKGK